MPDTLNTANPIHISKDELSIFRSPVDGAELDRHDENGLHAASGLTYRVTDDGIPLFTEHEISSEARVQAAHYDRIAKAYVANLEYPHTQEYMAFLDQVLDDATGTEPLGCVAEICCGHAEAINRYSDRIDVAVGIDISIEMLRVAIDENPGPRRYFIQGDATCMPLADNTFDTVFMLGGIHHVNARARLFSEIARILRQGGQLIFQKPLDDFLPWRLIRRVVYRWASALDADTERPLRRKETVPLLERNGFDVTQWRTEGFLGFCLFMNSDVLVANRAIAFVPGIRSVTRGFTRLDALTRRVHGMRNCGLQVVAHAQWTGDA